MADNASVPTRRPAYDPPSGKDGYQVHSWLESQVRKGATIHDRDGHRIALTDSMLEEPIVGYRKDGSPVWAIGGGSFVTGTSQELIYANIAAGTGKNTFTTEIAINDTTGMGAVAHVPVDFWTPSNLIGKALRIEAYGIVSSTVTPTYTFTTRLGTQGNVTAAIVAGTAALAAGSTITNLSWSCSATIVLTVVGAAGANSTVRGLGIHDAGANAITTNSGVNPYNAAASATAPTVATVDTSITNYVNFNVACSASNAANNVQLLGLYVFGLN